MALSPSPTSSSTQLDNPTQPKMEIVLFDPTQSCSSSTPPPPKIRNKSPGIRIVGGRIFDSENGKTCHQCRQKTMDFVVYCKGQRDDKACTMKYCHKCLMNRYGERAEAACQLADWKCPKCRGICNCSHCMKKRGYQPTGSLLYTAKANGFRSVLEMLTVNGPETISASVKKEEISYIGNGSSTPHFPALTLLSDNSITELKRIKLEESSMDDEMVDASQPIERMNDTQNEEARENGVEGGGQQPHKNRKKNWKKLARAKNNGSAGEVIKEECADSEKTEETL